MGKNYWMITTSLENFEISREMGFNLQGVKASQHRRAQRMQLEDRILYYIGGIQKFGATATITSTSFEDHKPIWKSSNGKEEYPFRVRTEPNFILKEDAFMDARQIGPRLDYVKRWPPENWHLAFHGNLHLLPQKDFKLIEGEMKKLIRGRGARGRRRGRNTPGSN